jgi:hypothetical protein
MVDAKALEKQIETGQELMGKAQGGDFEVNDLLKLQMFGIKLPKFVMSLLAADTVSRVVTGKGVVKAVKDGTAEVDGIKNNGFKSDANGFMSMVTGLITNVMGGTGSVFRGIANVADNAGVKEESFLGNIMSQITNVFDAEKVDAAKDRVKNKVEERKFTTSERVEAEKEAKRKAVEAKKSEPDRVENKTLMKDETILKLLAEVDAGNPAALGMLKEAGVSNELAARIREDAAATKETEATQQKPNEPEVALAVVRQLFTPEELAQFGLSGAEETKGPEQGAEGQTSGNIKSIVEQGPKTNDDKTPPAAAMSVA